MKLIAFILFFLSCTNTYAQPDARFEDGIFVCWQPDVKIKAEDFFLDGKTIAYSDMVCQRSGMCASLSLLTPIIVDIKNDTGISNKHQFKTYIIPVVNKSKSYKITQDSVFISRQKLLFDVEEWIARYMRKQISVSEKIKDQTLPEKIIAYKALMKDVVEKRNKLNYDIVVDIYLEPKQDAYNIWRLKINQMLDELKDFPTRPEDCVRFISAEPLDNTYTEYEFLVSEDQRK